MEIKGIKIGDKFKNGKHITCEVVDFYKVTSYLSNEVIRWECVVKGINTLATNTFTVPFATVAIHKIN